MEKVGLDRYDCTKGCGVYLIHKLKTPKSKYQSDMKRETHENKD